MSSSCTRSTWLYIFSGAVSSLRFWPHSFTTALLSCGGQRTADGGESEAGWGGRLNQVRTGIMLQVAA